MLPLPSHDQPRYTAASPEPSLEDDPVYRRHRHDWITFHTRFVSPDAFLTGVGRPAPAGEPVTVFSRERTFQLLWTIVLVVVARGGRGAEPAIGAGGGQAAASSGEARSRIPPGGVRRPARV